MTFSSLFLEYDPDGRLTASDDALWSSPHLRVTVRRLHPAPRLHRLGNRVVVIHGHPIANGRRDDNAVMDVLRSAPTLADAARALDGSFLLVQHDPDSGALTVANDRFAAYALYIHAAADRRICLGTCFRQVLLAARHRGGGALDSDGILSFLWLRRLLAERTFAEDINYLRSASVLKADARGVTVTPYWQPDLHARAPRGRALVAELADGLHQAVREHMSDPMRFGLLLSGGLDSRALLAAAPVPPTCFTTCLTRNNEFAVAAEVARVSNAEHHFLPRPLAIHDGHLDEAAALGGMQVYNEAQFLGYGPALASQADVLMIGLGLDIFFGGLYLPKETASLAGRGALHHRLLPLSADMAGFYLDKVKYRLKTSDPLSVLAAPLRAQARDRLRAQVETVLERGRALGGEGYGLWEYMHVHNLSRHYSFPMMASVRTFADCRAPALSNRLFDLALAMRAEDKVDGTPYQHAITSLSPAMMRIRNANTNLPAGWPLRRQTMVKAGLHVLGRMGFKRSVRSPGWQDRSWPLPRAQLEASPELMDRVRGLPRCPVLEDTGLFDSAGVAVAVAEHLDGRHDHTVLLNILLTLSSVLRPAAPGEGE